MPNQTPQPQISQGYADYVKSVASQIENDIRLDLVQCAV